MHGFLVGLGYIALAAFDGWVGTMIGRIICKLAGQYGDTEGRDYGDDSDGAR